MLELTAPGQIGGDLSQLEGAEGLAVRDRHPRHVGRAA